MSDDWYRKQSCPETLNALEEAANKFARRYNDIIPRPLTEEEEAAYAESSRKADVFTAKLGQLHELFESMDDFERETALDDLKARWAPDYDD